MANIATNIQNFHKVDLKTVFPEISKLFESNIIENGFSQFDSAFNGLDRGMSFQTINTATEQAGYVNDIYVSVKGSNLNSPILAITQLEFKTVIPALTIGVTGKIVMNTTNGVITGYLDNISFSTSEYILLMGMNWNIQAGVMNLNNFSMSTPHEFMSISGNNINPSSGDGIDKLEIASKESSLVFQGKINFKLDSITSFMNGDDVVTGTGLNQFLSSYTGNDNLSGGYGDDTLDGGTGSDILDGGSGINTAVYSGGKSSYSVSKNGAIYSVNNLYEDTDTLTNIAYLQFADGTVAIEDALPKPVVAPLPVVIETPKPVTPPFVIETPKPVVSTTQTNGNDQLTGTTKNDTLSSLAGDDTLIGGLGSDKLTGGSGADVFKFNKVKETGIDVKTRDTITDFSHSEKDKIDLSAIDANTKLAGDQAFKFIGSTAFSKTDASGQLRFDATSYILYGSTNADSKPEFSIQLNGVSSLVAADFVL